MALVTPVAMGSQVEMKASDCGNNFVTGPPGQLRSILKGSETTARAKPSDKKVAFAAFDGDVSEDDDFEVEFNNKCSMEMTVNKISALTFSQIGGSDPSQRYVLNSTFGNFTRRN
eukprot:GFUD01021126.1.p1 GENE.GFUD01021126.1~~GFUD01021126.1.p1  ORF type:complete len:115 (-),score=33.47 GFUD01021126.1:35-379(-)